MISQSEREKMLRAHSIGPRMIGHLADIGVERLSDLKGGDAEMLAMRINAALARKRLNRLGVEALRNLIALADVREGTRDRNRDLK